MEINDPVILDKLKSVKTKIQKLIEKGRLQDARGALGNYEKMIPDDIDIYSMRSVISIMEGNLDAAETIILAGLKNDSCIFDLLFNLAYIYEQKEKYQEAADMYSKAGTVADTDENMLNVKNALNNVKSLDNNVDFNKKKRLVFFVKKGMDSFIDDIIDGLSSEYWTRKIIIKNYKQIDIGMEWADVCWFECDELICYGSKLGLARRKKVICRLHRYEVSADYLKNVYWENVDKLIIVTEHLQKLLEINLPSISNSVDIILVHNGVNINRYKFSEHKPGYNIAIVDYLDYMKNPIMALQVINKLVKIDRRYKLYIAGQFQDKLIELYWNYQIDRMKLKENIFFEGWQNDINLWLEDKDYLLSTTIYEGLEYGIAEAMSMGIKPVINNFLYADESWDNEYLFNSIDEAVEIITSSEYESQNYRCYIKEKNSLEKQINQTKKLMMDIINKDSKKSKVANAKINYDTYIQNNIDFAPYSAEYINNFEFDSSQIVIGRKEKLTQSYQVIEFIIRNNNKKMLALTGTLYNCENNEFILPDYLSKSEHCKTIINYLELIVEDKSISFNNNGIASFIFDESIRKDVEANLHVYIWERGIPATEFLPLMAFQNIIKRYKLAGKYIDKSSIVLEAASGYGYGAAYYAGKVGCKKVVALDLAEDNIAFGKNTYDFSNISWVKGNVTELPFEDNTFDIYTSFETLEHLPLDVVDSYFKEAIRVLNKDGKFIMSTPNKAMRMSVHNPFHIKEYTFDELDALFKEYFKNIEYFSIYNLDLYDGINPYAYDYIFVGSNT